MAGNSGKSARGKPFEAGQSGNPTGRPKMPESVKLAFSGMMPLALDALRAILDGTDEDAKPSDRIKAADIVFDRNLGKPLQAVDANINGQVRSVDTSSLAPETRAALVDLAIEEINGADSD